MNTDLQEFLNQLHAEGVDHDSSQVDRAHRYRNLNPETAHFIAMLVQLMHAQKVVEIGTSNGYSTIWLADAVTTTGGTITTVDIESQHGAADNVERAGLTEPVEFVHADAGEYLAGVEDDSVDVLFLDAERTQYAGWWPHPYRVLRAGGLMLIDNAHHPAPDELTAFVALIADEPGLDQLVLPLGSGLIMARKV